MANEKKVTLSQLETALTRAKEAAPSTPADDTATDAEVREMLDRVFGTTTTESAE